MKKKNVKALLLRLLVFVLLFSVITHPLIIQTLASGMMHLEDEMEMLSQSDPHYLKRHSYNQGIYDGATYRLRNAADGSYLTVSGASEFSTIQAAAFYYIWENDVPGNQKIDLMLEKGKIYYFVLYNAAYTNATYEIRLQQFSIGCHSAQHGDPGMRPQDVYNLYYPSQRMGWCYSHKENCTSPIAQTEIHPATGKLYFNSDIFYYSGHGEEGKIKYTESNFLLATDLPDMSGCKLAVWACCHSGEPNENNISLVSQSFVRGAKASIGWKTSVNGEDVVTFMEQFFDFVEDGATIQDSLAAATALQGYGNAQQIVGNLVKQGYLYQTLYPINGGNDMDLASMNAQITVPVIDKFEYTLMTVNESLGFGLYSKLLNGIPTDDFYVEVYDDNGSVTNTFYSPYRLSASESAVQSDLPNGESVANHYYSCVDG